jgi:shikimate kinase
MARVLVTGMSGTGKTTVLDELRRRGHRTLDTDYDGWVLADGKWDEPRITAFLRDHGDVFVAGTVENQGRFRGCFDHVVLLSAPLPVLLERVSSRTNNPYGKTPEQRAEIEHFLGTVEPLLRQGASVELDGRRPVPELADLLETLMSRTH